MRPAAVLVPLREGPEGLELILTLRPVHLSSHGGQVAFPGGRVDSLDTSRWETALRETGEELGLSESQLTPLGALDDLATITHFHVTPWVALVDPAAQLLPAEDEVEEVFTVPLAHFQDPKRRRTMQMAGRPGTRETDRLSGRRHEVVFFITHPHVVWGATAAMIDNLLEVLGPC